MRQAHCKKQDDGPNLLIKCHESQVTNISVSSLYQATILQMYTSLFWISMQPSLLQECPTDWKKHGGTPKTREVSVSVKEHFQGCLAYSSSRGGNYIYC